MISQWNAFLLEKAGEWDVPATGTWKLLFSNNYQPNYSTLALLWFHEQDKFPRVVTKVFRQPQIPRREFDNLQQVYSVAPNWAPRPLHFGVQGEFWTLWMEGVPGLRFRASGGCAPATLCSAMKTLASIHAAVRKAVAPPDRDRYRRVISEPLQTVQQYGPSSAVCDGCARIAAKATQEWLDSQPVIPQHGDLFAGNLLSYQGQWHVIDWESFGMIDLSFYDLFTLLLSLLRARGDTPDQWEPSLLKQIPILIKCYAETLGVSCSDVSLLLPLTLVNWFHLQWSDGRKEFAVRMYKTIQHYFENVDLWEKAFLAG